MQPKIINGYRSQRGQFPFYAFLYMKPRYAPKIREACGGTLLNDEFILTAGHCVQNISKIEVHLGFWKKNEFEVGRQVFYARPKHFYLHPEYDDNELLNDVALIKLPRRAIFSDRVQPVQFPSVCDVYEGMDLIAIGNGLKSNGYLAKTLQYTILTIVNSTVCKDSYDSIDETKVFCAKGSYEPKGGISQGDSGI